VPFVVAAAVVADVTDVADVTNVDSAAVVVAVLWVPDDPQEATSVTMASARTSPLWCDIASSIIVELITRGNQSNFDTPI
jgi:hypothetical protein